MADKDDHDWFEALAGRPADASREAAREAQAIRAAMLAARQKESAPEFNTESGLQKLLFRLRQERLLGKETRRSWQTYTGLALAASLAVAVGLVVLQPKIQDEQPTFRGGPGEPQVLSDPAPEKLRERIVRDLEQLGLKPRVTEFGRIVTVEAEWPVQPESRHREFLQRYGLKAPTSQQLKLEIHPKK